MTLSAATQEQLLAAARAAAARAYCPYSCFPVGAAALTAGGQIVPGCNVENASFGLSVCAERVALFSAQAAGLTEVVALAVCCLKPRSEAPEARMPCGACRQVMQEFLPPDAPILIDGVGVFRLEELLPIPFILARGE